MKRKILNSVAKPVVILLAVLCCISFTACTSESSSGLAAAVGDTILQGAASEAGESSHTLADIPEYDGSSPYTVINDNIPGFSADEIAEAAASFENYSSLDSLGRCGVAEASIGKDLMPTEKRGSIGSVKPTGWQTVKYDNVDGKYLYNRCHLIGYQLSGENANENNLITGTRYLNVDGMLPFEDLVADYVKETGNHVLYRVTPIFDGNNLVAGGVQMEGLSVEDNGEAICFNIFAYNVQPGISIDYATGTSSLSTASAQSVNSGASSAASSATDSANSATASADTNSVTGVIRGNSNSHIYHCPGQSAYEEMSDSRYLVEFSTEENAQAAGYRKAKR